MDIKYELIPYDGFIGSKEFDFDKAIYDLNSQIELLSSQADNLDYVVAIASGIACGLLDILWVGEFDLTNGRSIASDKVDAFVKKTAEMFISIVTVATAGAFAGPIAVVLVGSNFAGLSGAALTSACLAYLGGGAIAAGGAGMLGGTIAIVGGGAALGIGVGAGVGGAVGSAGLLGKKNTIMQSAKLLTSVREIFLNDEHDVEFSNSVYEQYLQNITEVEKGLVELRLKKDVAKGKEKKTIAESIKKAEESVEAMKVARKNMLKYNSSFAEGLQVQR